jgi:photosystem II stability/assembly factor-like uncharacterized protein
MASCHLLGRIRHALPQIDTDPKLAAVEGLPWLQILLNLRRRIYSVSIDLSSMKTRKFTTVALATAFYVLVGVHFAFAQTWTQTTAPSNSWQSVVCSADGSKLFALVSPGTIYSSTNSGTTWDAATDPQLTHVSWQAIATSADGSRLLAAPQSGWIYFSTNAAANWMRQTNLPPTAWYAVALSGDGQKLFAFGKQMYISSDSGATWTTNNLPYQNGGTAVVSADGNTIVFAQTLYPPLIYSSTNTGVTWVTNTMPFYITGIASSADGRKLAVACLDGGIFNSTNSGVTWSVTTAPNIPWRAIAGSADGNTLLTTENYGNGGSIYSSTDAGATWVSNDIPSLHWNSVASSADGSKLFAAVSVYSSSPGPIFQFSATPSLRLNLQNSASNAALSWVIPSAPFIIQQSADLRNWEDVTNAPALNFNTLQDELTLPMTDANNFFRLRFQ